MLEQAESDVLILLDCCHSATANTSAGNGVTELISACAYNAIANGVGYYSFTKELTIELRDLSTKPSFTVAELYRNVFSRIQARRPEDGRERHPAPIHLSLTQDNPQYPRSIQLSIRPGHINRSSRTEGPLTGAPITPPSVQNNSTACRGSNLSSLPRVKEVTGHLEEACVTDSILPLSTKVPRMLLAVRLKEGYNGEELSVTLFKDWLRDIPAIVEEVKFEAGFGSFSSIAIVSIPIALSLYLPSDPAIIKIGPITTSNMAEETKSTKIKIPAEVQ